MTVSHLADQSPLAVEKAGDRIRVLALGVSGDTVPGRFSCARGIIIIAVGGHDDNPRFAGKLATVEGFRPANPWAPYGQMWVRFDDGVKLALLPDVDSWEVLHDG